MAKIRGIKPETWTDDKFVQLTPLARLLFIGMWNLACDNGHVEDSPVQMKMRLLPMDACDIGNLIDEMVTLGLVERSSGWLKVVNLVEHQKKPDRRFLTLCEHCAHDEQAVYVDTDKLPRTASKQGPQPTPTSSAQRVHGEHSVSTQRGHAGEGDGEGDGEMKNSCASADAERESTTSLDDDFAAWYSEYPRKRGRGQALRAYRLARRKVDHATLVASIRAQTPTLTAKGAEFVPYPATWLNGERWTDETEAPDQPADRPSWGRETLPSPPFEVIENPTALAEWRRDWEAGKPVPTADGAMRQRQAP